MKDQELEKEIQAKGLTAPRITPDDIEANIASEHYFTAADGIAPSVNEMVNRFLGWKLPEDFYPDCYVAFDREKAKQNKGWPIGTNLFHSGQAKEMFEHAIGKPEVPQSLGLLTFCVLVLKNGFTVTGESACASPENFDAGVGRMIARQNAISKVWPLMGYALKSKLSEMVTA